MLLLSCFIGCSSVIVEKSLVGNTRQRDIVCRNDYMFWLDILKSGDNAYCCPGTYSSYRKGSGISSNKLRNLKYYLYVIMSSTRFKVFAIPFVTPIFLVINLLKKKFTNLYNNLVIRI